MEERKEVAINEINKCIEYIEKNKLFKQEYAINFKEKGFFKKNIKSLNNELFEDFFKYYFNLIGEYYIGSNTSLYKQDIVEKFNKLNKKENSYNFNVNLFSEEKRINSDKTFLYFLIGKQIGCINRAFLLRKEEGFYCIKSLKVISNVTIGLINLINDHSMEEIKEKYENFYLENEKIINDNNIRASVNGLWNYYYIKEVIKKH